MKEKYILFNSAHDLLRFLMARRAAGNRSPSWEMVILGKFTYAVNFKTSEWDGSTDRFGGRIYDGPAEGRAIPINVLLEMFPLQRMPLNHNAGTESMVLAIPMTNPLDAMTKQEILYDAWRQVERTESARSAFHSCKMPSGGGWLAVRIDGVSPSFDFEKFRQANLGKFDQQKERLRAFAPAWDAGGCYLFVEWEYRYPKAEEFSVLYRDLAADLILCLAESPDNRVKSDRHSWWKSAWHVLEGDFYYTTGDLFNIELPESGITVHYPKSERFDLIKLPRRLAIGPISESLASSRELEARIGSLERELETLNAKQDRLVRLAHEEFFPIFAWEQRTEATLPSGLEHLLAKPLGELSRYLYFVTQNEDGSLIHYVAGLEPQRAGCASAVACDKLYLCNARWQNWKLPLFLRQGFALNIDINEEEMAALVRDAAPQPPDDLPPEAEAVCCLLEPSGDREQIPQFVWLAFSQSLDHMVAVTNQGAAGPGVALRAASHDAGRAAVACDVGVSEAALRLDTTLRERAEEKLKESEEAWEKVRQKLQAATFQNRVAEIAVQPLADARNPLAETWNQFVAKTLEADAVAAHFKLEQLGVWAGREPERTELLLQHEQGLIDVGNLINERNTEYDELLTRIKARNKSLADTCTALDRKLGELRAENTKLKGTVAQLAGKNAELGQEVKIREQSAEAVEKERARSDELKDELASFELGEEEAARALESNTGELETALDQFGGRLREGRELEHRMKSALPLFRRFLRALFGKRGGKS